MENNISQDYKDSFPDLMEIVKEKNITTDKHREEDKYKCCLK